MASAAAAAADSGLSVRAASFGQHHGSEITQYTLVNGAAGGIEVEVINYGAIITAVRQPDRNGVKGNVVLGYDQLAGWTAGMPWFNSLIGRHANRIGKGKFSIDGVVTQLELNNGANHLHGGAAAFNAKVMKSKTISGKNLQGEEYVGVSMSFTSPDGDDGYPGELDVETSFKLFQNNTLQMDFHAEVKDKPTVVNICNHAYWNLEAAESSTSTILDHTLRLNAASITELDDALIPTGRIIPVADTPYDFTTPRTIGSKLEALDKTLPAPGGYDINYVLNKDFTETGESLLKPREVSEGVHASFAARLSHEKSGRVMNVYTTAPGVQCYSGNFLDGKTLVGRNGVSYPKHGAVCLETQSFPDAVNHQEVWKNFPSGILRPGEKYQHVVQHVFSTQA